MVGGTRLASDFAADGPASDIPSGGRPSPPLRRILVFVDLVVLAIGWFSALLVHSLALPAHPGLSVLRAAGTVIFGTAAGLFLMSAAGLYRRRICQVRSVEIARIGRVSATLSVLAMFVSVGDGFQAAVLAGAAAGGVWMLLLAIERGFLREWIQGRRAGGQYRAPVLIFGAGDDALKTATFLQEHPVLGFDVRGLAGPVRPSEAVELRWFGEQAQDAAAAALARGVTGVIVDGASLTGNQLSQAVRDLSDLSLHVHIASGLRGVDWRRITIAPMADETFLTISPAHLSARQRVAKRALDLAVAGVLLVLASPVLFFAALFTWLTDRGPILFRQRRVGHGGEEFIVYKMRTMVVDAEAKLTELQDANRRDGPLFKMTSDPRVTKLGRILRATSVDELPQLFNVLEGTMSMVGPRPALPAEYEQFDSELTTRTLVKPGVTGLWQVEARDLSSFDLYRRFDLLYVENWSIGVDVAIIARTVTSILMRGGRAVLPGRRIPSVVRADVLE
jgi:exopolysaccharide biosynthesis polyprenyl glycosylphosphotransferase